MSLIVARQDKDFLLIVSDTKLTYPDHDVKSLKTNPAEGVIKSIILSDNQCISFAGEIDHAESALKEIGYSSSDEHIIEVLTRYHKISEYNTEFLYCTGSPLKVYKFKNNEYGIVHSSYLGDKAAFEIFQAHMNGGLPKKKQEKPHKSTSRSVKPQSGNFIEIENFDISISPSIASEKLSKMMAAMDYVIEQGNVNSVGGFKVQVLYDKKFSFSHYYDVYRSNFKLHGLGPHILGNGDADEGAYSVHFFDGASDHKTVALHIRQAELGIVYHRRDAGLLWPELLVKSDEIDFIDNILKNYRISARIETLDRARKYYKKGLEHFENKSWKEAATSFFQGLQFAKGIYKADFLFRLGVSQWNMNDRNGAMMTFNESIKVNPEMKEYIKITLAKAGVIFK